LVGDEYFVKEYTNFVCDADHRNISYELLWPIVVIWIFIIPMIQYKLLNRKKDRLDNIKTIYVYGILYTDYN
jgi:hypothetical protein